MIEFKFSDFFSPRRLCHWRRILWKSQYYSEEKIKSLQWRYLSRLLDHCFKKVPYYRNLFAKHRLKRSDFVSLEDLARIPILEKDVLLDQHEDFRPDNFERLRVSKIRTTGTTCSPMWVYWDLDVNLMELTCQWRHYAWAGYRLGDSFLDIRNYSEHLPNKYKWNWKCRALEISSRFVDRSNIGEWAAIIREHNIKLWRGHANAIDHLCRLFAEAEINDVKPKCLITVGETLQPYQRKFIESWTGRPVCDSFGLTEHCLLICQCPQGGYHIASEYGIVEIVRPDGSPAAQGEEGLIIATGLHNKAFPLLRYNTKDLAIVTDRRCACGRTLPLVEDLSGRLEECILDEGGNLVSSLHRAFRYTDGIRRAQLVQEISGSLDVYIVPASDFKKETEAVFVDGLKHELGESMKIFTHYVKEVPYPSRGKYRFIVSKLLNRNHAVKRAQRER